LLPPPPPAEVFKHLIQVETAGLLARRILDVALQMLAHNGTAGRTMKACSRATIVVARLFLRDLEGVATQSISLESEALSADPAKHSGLWLVAP